MSAHTDYDALLADLRERLAATSLIDALDSLDQIDSLLGNSESDSVSGLKIPYVTAEAARGDTWK